MIVPVIMRSRYALANIDSFCDLNIVISAIMTTETDLAKQAPSHQWERERAGHCGKPLTFIGQSIETNTIWDITSLLRQFVKKEGRCQDGKGDEGRQPSRT